MIRYRLRTLLIVLAIGLALLQFVVFLIPYNGETTELTAWFLGLDFVSYVVPLVQISALAIALTIGNGSSSNNQSPVPILRFTIRDVLWLTVVVGMSVAWWLGQEKLTTQLAESETAHRKWQHWAEHLRGQLNGIKLGGKWLMPYRLEFSPGSEEMHSVARQSGGEWVAPAGTTIEWRQDWADTR
jgi:hypothetical protein